MGYALFTKKKDAINKDSLKQLIEMTLKNLSQNERPGDVYNVKRIGRLLEVEAYYHETDERYKCVGFEVEVESQFSFNQGDKKVTTDLKSEVGFYSVWIGKVSATAPITFEEGNGNIGKAHGFTNGLGDDATVIKEIASVEEVANVYENLKTKQM